MSSDKPDQGIDWSNPAAIEAALVSDGLGDIDAEIRDGPGDSAIIMRYLEATDANGIMQSTARDTVERYQGDEVGAAMALNLTQILDGELPLDGHIGDTEANAVDGIVGLLQARRLEGLTGDELLRHLNINPALGGLNALFEAKEAVEGMHLDEVDQLRSLIDWSTVQDEIEEDEFEEDEGRFIDALALETLHEDEEDQDEEDDSVDEGPEYQI